MVAVVAKPWPRTRTGGAGGKRVIERWKVFGPGRWNGENWTESDIAELAENFRRFKRPINTDAPYYTPFVSLNHDDGTMGLANGDVLACGVDPADGWFWVTFDADPHVADLLDGGQLRAASIEWWNTKRKKDRELSGFPLTPDGKPVGLILRAVTLCGSMAQAVKGQPKAPKSRPKTGADLIQRFDNAVPPGRTFVRIPNVEEIIQKIMAAAPGITPEQAEAIAAAVSGGAPAEANAPPADGMGGDMGGMAANLPPDMPGGDEIKQAFRDLSAVIKRQGAELAAIKAEKTASAKAESDAMIQKFHDAVIAERKALPAEAARILDDLKKLTPTSREVTVGILTKQFGLTGKAAPKADRVFSDASAAGGSEPTLRERIMAKSVLGRSILAATAKQNAATN